MKNSFWFLLLVAVFALQCRNDSTQWSPELAFPIAFGELSLEDFIDSENLDSAGEVLFISIQETLTPVNLDDLLDLGDTIIEQVYTPDLGIGPISFANSVDIFSIDEEFTFNLEDAELNFAKITSGIINFSFESNADGYLDLTFLLPGISLEGESLSIIAQTEPASDSNLFESSFSVDVSGYEMNLTGIDGTDRNTIYGELAVATSAAPNYTAQIFGSDQITVNIQLQDIVFDEVRGFFGELDQELNEEIELDFPSYTSGSVGLEDINLGLEIKNYLGVDAIINLESLTAINSIESNSLDLDHSIVTEEINFTRAFETANYVIPDVELLEFNNLNSNLADFVSITPDQININALIEINPLGDITGGNDFYLRDYPLEIDVDLQVPLCAAVDTLILTDTLEINIDDVNQISNVLLKLNYENSFELGGELELLFPNANEPFGTLQISPAPSETESVNEVSELELDNDALENLKTSDFIVVQAKILTENSGFVKIQSDQKIDILLTAEARYEASF